MPGAFDVFFSYWTRDHAAVERIARALTDAGLCIFLDRWYLTPGQPWPQALERTLDACNAVAVFIGGEGLGPWQQRERDLALDRQAREPGFPVIPVLLGGGDPALGFLRLNTWVDLTGGPADPEALAILASAIRGEPPGPLARQRSEAARAAVCPYRGLRPFREEDEPFFFGRDSFAGTLTDTVLRQPFVAVVGASGSGKSSVVRAGLIPRLRRGAGNQVWDALTLVPTDRPLTSLAAALLPALEPDLSEVDRLAEVGKLAAHLADGTIALRDVAARVLARQPGTDRLLLFIDQWEELYTLCAEDAVRRGFVGQLLDAAGDRVCVVSTIRGDFMGRALDTRDLADRLQDAVVTIGPMTRDELAESIVRPAEKTGLTWELGLPETILDELGDEPGGLPLLEFLLEGVWAERRGSLLTHDAYVRLGRVAGAIAHRAEEVFERLNDSERQAAQGLLMRMVRPGEGVEDTRRRAVLADTDAVVDAAVRRLAGERLVVTGRDGGSGRMTVEVAHEALIRRWRRLREWIDADREFLRTRERLAAQARLWESEGEPPDRLLPPGRPLAEGEDLLAIRRADLETLLIKYVEASAAAARASERRAKRHVRAFITVMAIVTVAAICFGGVAWWQREAVDRYASDLELSRSRALSALAELEAENGLPGTALHLALASVQSDPPTVVKMDDPIGPVVSALRNLHELRRFKGLEEEGTVFSVSFSPDGRTIATGSSDGTARLWDVVTGKQIAILSGHQHSRVNSVAFSPDGRMLATGSSDKTGRLWEVATGKEIGILRGHDGSVESIAFSRDGKLAVTGSEDATVRLWDVLKHTQINAFRGHSEGVTAVAFSPNDEFVASSSWDTTVRLWEVATSKATATFAHDKWVMSVAFSPDGQLLATASGGLFDTGEVRLWEISSGRKTDVFSHERRVIAVGFSPDGRNLATATANTPRENTEKSARIWDVKSGKEIAVLRGHEAMVQSVVFSPDGRLLVTGSSDSTARVWQVETARKFKFPLRISFGSHSYKGKVNSVSFSPDGRMIAFAADGGFAYLFDSATGLNTAELKGHSSSVSSVTFSSDGRLLATGSADWTAKLWEPMTGHEIAEFKGHEAGVRSVAFSRDEQLLATGSWDKTARLWKLHSSVASKVLRGHLDAVTSVAFSQDNRMLATGSLDKTARIWDVAAGIQVAVLSGHAGGVTSVAFSPDGETLATASEDRTVRLWNLRASVVTAVLHGHQSAITSVSYSADGLMLATTSVDNTTRLWDAKGGEPLTVLVGHNDRVTSSSFSSDGFRIATASWDNSVYIWGVPRTLIDYACARAAEFPFSDEDKERFGVKNEWCADETSNAFRSKLGLDKPFANPATASTQ